jgi:hypothetical protein
MDEDEIHQGIEDSVVDEVGSSHYNSLSKRAGGSCGQDSDYDIEEKIQHVKRSRELDTSRFSGPSLFSRPSSTQSDEPGK